MNNYHLYEEIGHGKFSMVYKGRKKHTIRYVAVKSIEKNRRDKVMIEVGVLSRLNHPNVVGFTGWYETRNHLWIIFEYCAGGDVLRLLRQDGRLPEDVVRRFGGDVCAGLLHVHSRGIIYCDMKPANVLFSENGCLKLSEFGHSQRLEDIADALEEGTQLPRRGTPHYMAPELFQEGGMHSFASDVWAVGCVLHEMVMGRPPFQSSSFAQLQSIVLVEQTPQVANASADFQALFAFLLRKDPLHRAEWRDIRAHSFWQGLPVGNDADAEALPVQPHLEELRRLWQRVAETTPSVARRTESSAVGPAGEASDLRQERNLEAGRAHGAVGQVAKTPSPGPARLSYTLDPSNFDTSGVDLEPPQASPAPPPLADASNFAPAARENAANVANVNSTVTVQQGVDLKSRLGNPLFARAHEAMLVPSNEGVRPIARNPQIEDPESLETRADLPFAVLRLEEICSRSHADLEAFLMKVYKCIAQGSQDQKVEALKYLEQICCHMHVADVVVNSSLLRLVLRMLLARAKTGSGSVGANAAAPLVLRVRLLSLIGQLLRHATYLEPSIAELGLIDALLEGLRRNNDSIVRRRSVAALGELLFYIATQPAMSAPSGTAQEAGAACSDGWQVPAPAIRTLSEILICASEDEVVRHYAAKTVENVATQCPPIAHRWFYSSELVHALAGHARRSSWDAFRLSCLAAVAHLARCRPDGTKTDSARMESDLVAVAVGQLAPHGIPHGLQLLATMLFDAARIEDVDAVLPDNVIDVLMGILAQPRYAGGLRGRVCVLLAMLFTMDDAWESRRLRLAIDRSLVPHVDRLGREKDPFVAQCVTVAAAIMEVVVVAILQSVMEGVRQLSAGVSTASDIAGGLVQVLPVLLHLLSSAALCGSVFEARALPILGAICEIVARSPPQTPSQAGGTAFYQLQPLVLMIMEALAAQQSILLEHAPQVVRCILPALAVCLSSNRADVRLLALKAFSVACIVLLNDSHIYEPAAAKPTETTLLLEALFGSRALPVVPRLLTDDAPAPSCVLRLLAALLSRGSSAAAGAVRDPGLLQPLLTALRGQQALSLHTALLAQCLLRGRSVHLHELSDAGVFDSVYSALRDAADVASGHAAQMDFAMVDAALCVAEEALSQVSARLQQPQLQQQPLSIISELGPLIQLLPLLATLCVQLAHIGLLPLLDRSAECCQHLANLSRACAAGGRRAVLDASGRDIRLLFEALLAASRWRQASDDDAALARLGAPVGGAASAAAGAGASALGNVQRRLLAVLEWGVSAGVGVDVRAELAAGVERLLRDRMLGDDPHLARDARSFIASVVSRGSGVG
eukprot:TRINITY_DN1405_c0_g3_i1.p1 TRINITY_DN1405_c0_g3~~TRINITY_DN1405_c0_g3_i1.p1  ORF type:complete len:1319 (-),score=194.91 TRINITY_DN1405_c0_g3_i1:56-4012(-)